MALRNISRAILSPVFLPCLILCAATPIRANPSSLPTSSPSTVSRPEVHFVGRWIVSEPAVRTTARGNYEARAYHRILPVAHGFLSIGDISYTRMPVSGNGAAAAELKALPSQIELALGIKLLQRSVGATQVYESYWAQAHRFFRLMIRSEKKAVSYSVALLPPGYAEITLTESELIQRSLAGEKAPRLSDFEERWASFTRLLPSAMADTAAEVCPVTCSTADTACYIKYATCHSTDAETRLSSGLNGAFKKFVGDMQDRGGDLAGKAGKISTSLQLLANEAVTRLSGAEGVAEGAVGGASNSGVSALTGALTTVVGGVVSSIPMATGLANVVDGAMAGAKALYGLLFDGKQARLPAEVIKEFDSIKQGMMLLNDKMKDINEKVDNSLLFIKTVAQKTNTNFEDSVTSMSGALGSQLDTVKARREALERTLASSDDGSECRKSIQAQLNGLDSLIKQSEDVKKALDPEMALQTCRNLRQAALRITDLEMKQQAFRIQLLSKQEEIQKAYSDQEAIVAAAATKIDKSTENYWKSTKIDTDQRLAGVVAVYGQAFKSFATECQSECTILFPDVKTKKFLFFSKTTSDPRATRCMTLKCSDAEFVKDEPGSLWKQRRTDAKISHDEEIVEVNKYYEDYKRRPASYNSGAKGNWDTTFMSWMKQLLAEQAELRTRIDHAKNSIKNIDELCKN